MPEQKNKPVPQTKETPAKTDKAKNLKNEKLDDDVEALMAEIDEVLEENAEEFVRNYVQRGGQ